MSTSNFDVSNFLDATTTQESVRRPPIPVGDYKGIIGDLTVEDWVSSKDPTKSGKKFVVPIELDLPGDVVESIGLSSPLLKVQDSIMLELNSSGAIDYSPGKNSKLRRYREATGNNQSGKPFSPRSLSGHVVTVRISHREYPEGSGDLFEQVDGIAAAN
jgi:hypothetical protein